MRKLFCKVFKSLMALVVAISMLSPASFAQSEVDSLIQILVSKGVISQGESIQILEEAASQAKIQQVKAIKEGPSWLANTKFKGDLRIRHQYENKEADADEPESRLRTRFRYGFTNQINDKLSVGMRMATGSSSDPRSTNQTWSDDVVFQKWNFNLDQAYFDWKPFDSFQLIGGKREVKKIMLRQSDLLWDSDLTFDGATVKLSYDFDNGFKTFMYGGAYVLDQEVHNDNSNENPWMFHIQPGFELCTKGDASRTKTKFGVSLFNFRNVGQHAPADAINTGKTDADGDGNTAENGAFKYDYAVINPSLSFTYSWGGSKNNTYSWKTFGDYVYNPDPQDSGFLLGTKIGYSKVGKKFADWQLGYNWRYLENDAFLAVFSDSDAYSGNSNVKGHEVTFNFGLAKNISLGFDYYYMEPISGSGRRTENIFQTDLLFKF